MTTTVPTIDISGWTTGDPEARALIAAAVDDAARNVGFLQIVGHGVPVAVVQGALDAMHDFFDRPVDEKERVAYPGLAVNRGYCASESEALAYSLAEPTPPDLLESYVVGSTHVDLDDPAVVVEIEDIFHPNIWPDAPAWFEPAVTAYFDAVNVVARRMTEIFAVALGLPEQWFAPSLTHSTETLRLNHFERRPGDRDPLPGQQRLGAHTDYGIVTVLHADPVPGLELMGADGAWHGVVPDPGCFVVNLGDLLAQWTNDRWRSTLHRVVPPPVGGTGACRRRSLAFFLDGNHDAIIECLPTCTSVDDPPRYPPTTAGDHLKAKLLAGRTQTTAPAVGLTDTVGERRRAALG